MTTNPFNLTRAKIETAVANILGRKVFDSLKIGGADLSSMHRDAMVLAFVYGKGSPDDVMVLKAARLFLDRHGYYPN